MNTMVPPAMVSAVHCGSPWAWLAPAGIAPQRRPAPLGRSSRARPCRLGHDADRLHGGDLGRELFDAARGVGRARDEVRGDSSGGNEHRSADARPSRGVHDPLVRPELVVS